MRTIYSQICVNFSFLGKNRDEVLKELDKMKRESWSIENSLKTRPSKITPEELAQASLVQ